MSIRLKCNIFSITGPFILAFKDLEIWKSQIELGIRKMSLSIPNLTFELCYTFLLP